MKKVLMLGCAALLAAVVCTGCTSVVSTRKLNGVDISGTGDKVLCHTMVEIPYVYVFGIPFVGGSAAGNGKSSFFCNNANVIDAMSLLTLEAKSKGAARLVNVSTGISEKDLFCWIVTCRTFYASGTGVRNRAEAMRQINDDNYGDGAVPLQ